MRDPDVFAKPSSFVVFLFCFVWIYNVKHEFKSVFPSWECCLVV